MPNPYSFCCEIWQKNVEHRKLLVRARVQRHISKEIWVPQGIAGWELCVYDVFQKNERSNQAALAAIQ